MLVVCQSVTIFPSLPFSNPHGQWLTGEWSMTIVVEGGFEEVGQESPSKRKVK